jgi:RecA/RadA recombinase
MPAVSAADALRDLNSADTSRYVSTSLSELDVLLGHRSANHDGRNDNVEEARSGGVVRGQVTEVVGPPGVGKTALG